MSLTPCTKLTKNLPWRSFFFQNRLRANGCGCYSQGQDRCNASFDQFLFRLWSFASGEVSDEVWYHVENVDNQVARCTVFISVVLDSVTAAGKGCLILTSTYLLWNSSYKF